MTRTWISGVLLAAGTWGCGSAGTAVNVTGEPAITVTPHSQWHQPGEAIDFTVNATNFAPGSLGLHVGLATDELAVRNNLGDVQWNGAPWAWQAVVSPPLTREQKSVTVHIRPGNLPLGWHRFVFFPQQSTPRGGPLTEGAPVDAWVLISPTAPIPPIKNRVHPDN